MDVLTNASETCWRSTRTVVAARYRFGSDIVRLAAPANAATNTRIASHLRRCQISRTKSNPRSFCSRDRGTAILFPTAVAAAGRRTLPLFHATKRENSTTYSCRLCSPHFWRKAQPPATLRRRVRRRCGGRRDMSEQHDPRRPCEHSDVQQRTRILDVVQVVASASRFPPQCCSRIDSAPGPSRSARAEPSCAACNSRSHSP